MSQVTVKTWAEKYIRIVPSGTAFMKDAYSKTILNSPSHQNPTACYDFADELLQFALSLYRMASIQYTNKIWHTEIRGLSCQSKAAGRLYIPLCLHCISIQSSSRTKGLTGLTTDCHLDLSRLADLQKWIIFSHSWTQQRSQSACRYFPNYAIWETSSSHIDAMCCRA